MESYHLRRKEKTISDDSELQRLLQEGKYIILGFCRNDEPYVVTMNYGFDSERNALYFHCAKEGFKLDLIKKNPRVCGTVIEDLGYQTGDCEHAYRSLIIRGTMHVVEDIDEIRHGLELLIDHLEENPAPVKERTFKKPTVLETLLILRLDIESITGKDNSSASS